MSDHWEAVDLLREEIKNRVRNLAEEREECKQRKIEFCPVCREQNDTIQSLQASRDFLERS